MKAICEKSAFKGKLSTFKELQLKFNLRVIGLCSQNHIS